MLGEGKRSKQGEPCLQVRLSSDRMQIEKFLCRIARWPTSNKAGCGGKCENRWKQPYRCLLIGYIVRGVGEGGSQVRPASWFG